LSVAAEYVHVAYSRDEQFKSEERFHLMLLAGAHALLDHRVALLLQSVGVDAPQIEERLGGTCFKYIVMDSDGTIAANYCDIVRANHATRQLLGRIP